MSEISFYKQAQDYRVLNKTLSNPLVKQVNIRTDIDIYNPVLYLQEFDIAYNYFEWNSRYYFIQSAYYTAKQIWRLQCHIDVLMTYKDIILDSVVEISQNANINNYYDGGDWESEIKPEIEFFNSTVTLPDIFTNVIIGVS